MLGPPMLGPPGLSIKSSDKTTQMCGSTVNEPTTGAAIRFAGDLWLEGQDAVSAARRSHRRRVLAAAQTMTMSSTQWCGASRRTPFALGQEGVVKEALSMLARRLPYHPGGQGMM